MQYLILDFPINLLKLPYFRKYTRLMEVSHFNVKIGANHDRQQKNDCRYTHINPMLLIIWHAAFLLRLLH